MDWSDTWFSTLYRSSVLVCIISLVVYISISIYSWTQPVSTCDMSTVGTVVVGVGRAGGARVRDLQLTEQYPDVSNLRLAGYVSRRELELPGAKSLSLEQALHSDDVQAIVVCTENHSHEDISRKALEAGKHVLVEFPLAVTSSAAKELFDLADKKGLVCHEEDIGMLVESHKTLKARMTENSDLVEANFTLKGRFNGWIEDTEKSGSPFVTSINLLHAFLDLCGDLTPVDASLKVDADGGSEAMGKLHTKQGKPITINISRQKDGVPRHQSFSFSFADGTTIDSNSMPRPSGPPPPQSPDKPGLFMQDLGMFASLVSQKQQKQPQTDNEKTSRWLTIRGLELAEQLAEMAK